MRKAGLTGIEVRVERTEDRATISTLSSSAIAGTAGSHATS